MVIVKMLFFRLVNCIKLLFSCMDFFWSFEYLWVVVRGRFFYDKGMVIFLMIWRKDVLCGINVVLSKGRCGMRFFKVSWICWVDMFCR